MDEFWFAFVVGCFCGGVIVALVTIWYLCQAEEKQPEHQKGYDLVAAAEAVAEAAWRRQSEN